MQVPDAYERRTTVHMRRGTQFAGVLLFAAVGAAVVWHGSRDESGSLATSGVGIESKPSDRDWVVREPTPRGSEAAPTPPEEAQPIHLPRRVAARPEASGLARQLSGDPRLIGFPAPEVKSFDGSGPGPLSEITYRLPSGALLLIVQEQLSRPLPLEAVVSNGEHLYEKLDDGSELVLVMRSPEAFSQALRITNDGIVYNLTAQGVPARRIAPPLTSEQLRQVAVAIA